MDGKVFLVSEQVTGINCPPLYPRCRCDTVAVTDFSLGDTRAARDPVTDKQVFVEKMNYKEWYEKYVENVPAAKKAAQETQHKKNEVQKNNTDTILSTAQGSSNLSNVHYMRDYQKADGSFDLEKAKTDYRKFLQTVPEKHRMYLEQSMETVEYKIERLSGGAFGYDVVDDVMYCDPINEDFWEYPWETVFTHELAHRIDIMFVDSMQNELFSKAIAKAKSIIEKDPYQFVKFCNKNDSIGYLSDILDAISEHQYKFPFSHSVKYWNIKGNKEREIFANLFSLESVQDIEKLDFLKTEFAEVFEVYTQNMEEVL